ncbi:myb/sant-like dna-binding domain [Holotrichia oblita]|uniref:Myb/sant-like dna-binding domain n=1 Tax=Holotrichia oblita TaxID=644536 RepID=A0ACB9TWG7_HOLOL|nr:myb/sant-like dna-binding domain [Holotrichia oblita]
MSNITICSHEIVRDANNDIITMGNNILVRNKTKNEVNALRNNEICEIFGFQIEEEINRTILYEHEQTNDQTHNRKWGKTETLTLLELYKHFYADLQCTTKRNDVVYQQISDELKNKNYNFSRQQDGIKRSGAATIYFEYADILNEILGTKPNVEPIAIADTSSSENVLSPQNMSDISIEENSDVFACEEHGQKKRKRNDIERRHQEKMTLLSDIKTSFETMFQQLIEKL